MIALTAAQLAKVAAAAHVAPHAVHAVIAGEAVCPQTIASVEAALTRLQYAPTVRVTAGVVVARAAGGGR